MTDIRPTQLKFEISAPIEDVWKAGWRLSQAPKAEAREAGLLIIPWTVNDPSAVEVLIGAGVDGVITDRPDLILGT